MEVVSSADVCYELFQTLHGFAEHESRREGNGVSEPNIPRTKTVCTTVVLHSQSHKGRVGATAKGVTIPFRWTVMLTAEPTR